MSLKYAIPTDGNICSAHFGRCPEYTIFELKDQEITNRKIVPNPGHSTGSIPKLMKELGVNVMVAGGMGWRAMEFFKEYEIDTILGVTGEIDSIINQIKEGNLVGGSSLCSPGSGTDYGLDKSDGHHHQD